MPNIPLSAISIFSLLKSLCKPYEIGPVSLRFLQKKRKIPHKGTGDMFTKAKSNMSKLCPGTHSPRCHSRGGGQICGGGEEGWPAAVWYPVKHCTVWTLFIHTHFLIAVPHCVHLLFFLSWHHMLPRQHHFHSEKRCTEVINLSKVTRVLNGRGRTF